MFEARYERVISMGKAKMLAWPRLIRMLVWFGKPGPIPGVTLIAAPCVSRATGMEKVPMTVAGRPGCGSVSTSTTLVPCRRCVPSGILTPIAMSDEEKMVLRRMMMSPPPPENGIIW
ncbi:Uncharacterised protein [Mycobacteroides abscessus subsp. abscessus]|nr:Uncharacterised protein [Mycobacteroides abscessus subsp. abscessus]